MSDRVPASQIEQIVGVARAPVDHYGRSVTAEERFYILHSRACVDTTPDLRDCSYSLALDRGIDPEVWPDDAAARLTVIDGHLVPA